MILEWKFGSLTTECSTTEQIIIGFAIQNV